MAFFDTLGSSLLNLGTSFLGGQISARNNKKFRKAQLTQANQNGVIGPPIPNRVPATQATKRPIAYGLEAARVAHASWPHAGLGGQQLRKRRRMNVLNYSALKRSLRRLEGFQRTVKRVEKAMPKKTTRRRSTVNVPHHHH